MKIQKDKTGQFMGVDEYRKLPFINYTACKEFEDSRIKFYKKYIAQEAMAETKSSAMIFGDLLHCLLLNREDFDSKFVRLSVGATPKPQMKKFCDNLWKVTQSYMDPSGVVSSDMMSMMEEAYNMTAYSESGERVAFKTKSFEKVVSNFPEEGELYYSILRNSFDKSVIDAKTYSMAEMCVSELYSNPVTKGVVSLETSKEYVVLKEHAILFTYMEQKLKALCDIIVIDKKSKKISLYDIKSSGWSFDSFDSNIIKNRYYLQWSLYYKAVRAWADDNGYKDFEVVPMQFIVVSKDLSENPLIYTTSLRDLYYGTQGFTRNGKVYKGLDSIISEIVWHSAFGIWNMSYKDYQNKGIRRVSLFEE